MIFARQAVIATLAVNAGLWASANTAIAQVAKFSWANVHVIDAKKFLSSVNVTIPVDAPFQLTIQNDKKALAFARHGFQMRVFRADANWHPLPYQKGQSVPYIIFPPCDVFLSSRWPGVSPTGFDLVFGAPSNLSYLAVGPGGKLTDGYWLVIFETVDDDHDVLRLNGPEAAAYFSYAARFVITDGGANYTVADLPVQTPGELQQFGRLKAEAAVNDRSRDCMHVQTVTAAAQLKLASAEQCGGVDTSGVGSGPSVRADGPASG